MPQNNEFSQSSGRIYQNLLDGSALQTKTLGTLSTRKPTPEDKQAFEDTIEHFKQKIQKIQGVSNAFENFQYPNAEKNYMRKKKRLLKIDFQEGGSLDWITIRYVTPPMTVELNGIYHIGVQYEDEDDEKIRYSIMNNIPKEDINLRGRILDSLLQDSLENDSDYKVTLQHHIATTISCTPEGYLCH